MFNARLLGWAESALLEKKTVADTTFPQLSQLTIIIPSFCRQEYLVRQVVYWAHSRATVIIVDGSPLSIGAQLEYLIRDLPNITYLSLFDSYTNRIKEACRHIKTHYAMCLADDDFFLMKGLCVAIEHLDQVHDVVACIGQATAVDFDHQRRRAHFFPYGGSLWKYQVRNFDAPERVRSGINAYRSATSYAVFRAPIFMEIWHGLEMTSCLEATEYEHAISTYTLGGLSSIDDRYWIRSFECDPVDSPIDGTRHLDFSTWWSSHEYQRERVEFVNRRTNSLSEHSSLKREEAENVILEVIDFILSDKSTGLMNELPISSLVNRFSKVIRSSPYLDKLRSTKIGIAIRNRIRNQVWEAIRDSAATSAVSLASGRVYHLERELEDILAFMSHFYAARRLSDQEARKVTSRIPAAG